MAVDLSIVNRDREIMMVIADRDHELEDLIVILRTFLKMSIKTSLETSVRSTDVSRDVRTDVSRAIVTYQDRVWILIVIVRLEG